MSWLTNIVRPRIRKLVAREVPDKLWVKCPSCDQMIFHRELEANLRVCPHCNHHMRLRVNDRLAALYDGGAYQTIELPETVVDPLKFRDRKRYVERLKEAQSATEHNDAIVVAHGKIGGLPLVVAALDFEFMAGSMGIAVGEGFIAAARLAVLQEAPLLVIPASGGARMQEGILSLMQMPRTVIAVEEVREAGLPYIVLMTDPTTGGVSASFAMLGDIAIAEPGAVIGFAGRRVIEETIREQLPDDFQRAEHLFEHGMLDMVVPRHELRDTLIRVLRLLLQPRPPADVLALPQDDGMVDEGAVPEEAVAQPALEPPPQDNSHGGDGGDGGEDARAKD
jgi:acetyl-CoA carboxylase carboxyl transferase subunit beta